MNLPRNVAFCMDRLEGAGYPTYAVGGCVRDDCLGLQPHDYDLCTAATPEETERVFSDQRLVLAGKKHGTVGVVRQEEVVEITTFRQEGGYADNRHPDWVRFVTGIEEDLARRDFTVNAMAWSPTRGFADPFGGREDLKKGVLRAVGDPRQRFREDSLRILRGVRFAVRYHLEPEPETAAAMEELSPLMDGLARERVFDELCRLLPTVTAGDLIRFAPVLTQVIPELRPMLGFDQRSPHHAYDLYTHVAHVVEAVPGTLPLRWAALLHDVGKIPCFTTDETGRGHFYGHAGVGAEIAEEILRRLKAPNALREQVVTLIASHMTRLEEDPKFLKRRLRSLGWETMEQLLLLQEADMGSKGTGNPEELHQFSRIQALLETIRREQACLTLRDLAVKGDDLMALGFSGRQIGTALNQLLEAVVEETLPNDREALLEAAKQFRP